MSENINVEAIFGENVFNDSVMKERLPKSVYKKLKQTIEDGSELDPTIADVVAHAMKDWAVDNGATHYTHWFQPLTGITAEKHRSLLHCLHIILIRRHKNTAFQVNDGGANRLIGGVFRIQILLSAPGNAIVFTITENTYQMKFRSTHGDAVKMVQSTIGMLYNGRRAHVPICNFIKLICRIPLFMTITQPRCKHCQFTTAFLFGGKPGGK